MAVSESLVSICHLAKAFVAEVANHLWCPVTLNKNLYEIFRERIAKQVVRTPSGLRRIKKWALWRGRPPPKRKTKEKISCME
jgi:hypothetical protein